METTNEKLSSQSYWDEVLKSARLPRLNTRKSYLYSITMKFVDKAIRSRNYKTFFEVGCGSSGWLPFFAKEYNLEVSGLDYSEVGCELARKNLQLQHIPFGDIFCKDFFKPSPTEGKKYDIVFSYGVIEHFSDPSKIVGIFASFLKDDGLIISLVPNLNGLCGMLTRVLLPDVYKIHNKINARQLASFHTDNSLEIIKNRYAGIHDFGVVPWVKSDHRLLKEGTFRRKLILFVLKASDKVTGVIFRLLPFDIPSKYFSPYIICIAKKIRSA